MTIEQWGVISVPHLLWQGTSVYNGHFGGPMPVTPFALRLAVELSVPVLPTSKDSKDSNTQPSDNGKNAITDCATPAAHPYIKGIQVCLNDGPHPLSRGVDKEITKINWRNLKIFLGTTGPILNKLVLKHDRVKGISVGSKEEPRLFPGGDNNEIAKIHGQNLKIFFSRNAGSISTKLGTKHPCVMRFKLV